MGALEIDGVAGLRARIGEELGVSGWLDVTQERVAAFADVSGDHQWIHLDPERAAQTPFGGTVAHGMFTLSLGSQLTAEIFTVTGVAMGVHYGFNSVRFPAALPVGSRVRMRCRLDSVEERAGAVQTVCTQTFERDGGDRPVCVAEQVAMLYIG